MTDHPQGDLLVHLIALQSRINKRLAGPLSGHGLSLTEYLVLRELSQAPDGRMRRIDLAAQVGLSASGVTRLLNPMEKVGLVRKEEAARDARISLVALTPAGKRIFREASTSFNDVAQAFLEPLGARDQSYLQKITDALK